MPKYSVITEASKFVLLATSQLPDTLPCVKPNLIFAKIWGGSGTKKRKTGHPIFLTLLTFKTY